ESNNQVIVELLYGPLLREEDEDEDFSLDEEYELVSEMKKRRMEEGTLRIFETDHYVEGLLRRCLTIIDEGSNKSR
ncbi:MAG: peptidase S55, partial [Acetomicrobium sp.]